MLVLRTIIGVLGMAAVIAGVLIFLAAGWLTVAIVVIGVTAIVSGLLWLIRHLLLRPGSG